MLRNIKILFLLLLAGIILAPGIGFAVFGMPDPYGQRPYKDYPTRKSMLSSVEYRDQGADALVERLPLRKQALQLQGRFSLLLNAVNTPRLFSGEDKWLFFKDQFSRNNCESSLRIEKGLERLDVITGFASLTGPDLLFSSSPNKFSIYPDKAGATGSKFSDCYIENLSMIETTIASWNREDVLLHHEALRKLRAEGELSFRSQDTHWTTQGGLVAYDDILYWLGYRGPKLKDSLDFEVAPSLIPSDLGNSMLLLEAPALDVAPTQESLEKFVSQNDLPQSKTLIIHDSFYKTIWPFIDPLLPNSKRLHYFNDRSKVGSELETADNVVINIVERSLFLHLENSIMGWNSAVGQKIISENQKAAETCDWDASENWLREDHAPKVTLFNFDLSPDGTAIPKSTDPIMVFDVSGLNSAEGICLELDLTTTEDTRFEVFLQNRKWPEQKNRWVAGRSMFYTLKSGANTIRIVIPVLSDDNFLRVDPVGSKSEFKMKSARLVAFAQ